MSTTVLERPQTISLDNLSSEVSIQIDDFGRTMVKQLLSIGEKTSHAWQEILQQTQQANPSAYIRKAQQTFTEWKKNTGYSDLAQMSFNFFTWYQALPAQFQQELLEIQNWSRSVLCALTKIPLKAAQYYIKEGKNGVRHTMKSIKCLLIGCGKKYLELGQRMTEQDWQLIEYKIKQVTAENLPSLRELAARLATEANRPVFQATGMIEPYSDDAIAALQQLGYKTTSLLKPESQKYTESDLEQALEKRIREVEEKERQNFYTQISTLETENYQYKSTIAALETQLKNKEIEEKERENFHTQISTLETENHQYQVTIATLEAQLKNPTPNIAIENHLAPLEKELSLINLEVTPSAEDTVIENDSALPKALPTNPVEEKERWEPVTKFVQNGVVGVIKDGHIVAYGTMQRQVGKKISVKLENGLMNLYELSELRLKMAQVTSQKKSRIKRDKSQGFGR